MLDLGAIVERLTSRTLNDEDIQFLREMLQDNISQQISQAGKFNLALGKGNNIQVGDQYGVTIEQIRILIQELKTFQYSSTDSEANQSRGQDRTFQKIILDENTIAIINIRLEVIEEISQAGYLLEQQQQELKQLKQSLLTFEKLNQNLQNIAVLADNLIQEAITSMRNQLDALKLSGKILTREAVKSRKLAHELDCHQRETDILQTFVDKLEYSRKGADWLLKSIDALVKYSSESALKQFPEVKASASDELIDDFRFSIEEFLEQVNWCLQWGSYEILDSPEIALIFHADLYEAAFQATKRAISRDLRHEVITEIEACLDYLISRLPFYS
ncbi:MAG: hypothetical protein NW224_12275 [Leptolyngbyaceae cyanobacterium bins.302]|nr:hypothetical protein [Leptolyngbyaceae cyanobacterium bins.302]